MSTPRKVHYIRPMDWKHGHIDMSHGSGGRAQKQLIDSLFAPLFNNPVLAQGDDGAVLPADAAGGRWVLSTDGHVVSPLFFPGGDIGALAVHGSINDVAVMGAEPRYLTASFIIEAGFALADLKKIVQSMADAAHRAGVPIVTGDTKVVEKGKGDGVFITTTCMGKIPARRLAANSAQAQDGHGPCSGKRVQVGDAIIMSGTIGDHGLAILSQREGLQFSASSTPLLSDSQALHGLIAAVLDAGIDVHAMRDPTRGGVATTLNEIAHQAQVGMQLQETALPIRPSVASACEFLGIDPLYSANEGKVLIFCAAQDSERCLTMMRARPEGQQAAQIGQVVTDPHYFVHMQTTMGGVRMVDWLSGDQLPRIC